MNRREKILAIVVGTFVGSLVIYMSVNRLIVSGVRKLDRRETQLLETIEKNQRQLNSYQVRASRLGNLIDETFGSDENVTSERVRERLDQLLKTTGMEISLNPVTGSKSQGHYKEIGWAVTATGKVDQLINFLYLLNAEPYLHRVASLSLKPRHRSGQMEIKLRHMTIVPVVQKGEEFPPGRIAQLGSREKLGSERRRQYDVISARDPFRPYKKYVEPPKPPPEEKPPEEAPPTKASDSLKVVALATWAGQQEVHIRNLSTGKTEVLKPGEGLADGKIVMIDYRLMPLPGKSEMLSPSRLIFKKGNDYWAVELGQEVAEKHRLSDADLPEELKSK